VVARSVAFSVAMERKADESPGRRQGGRPQKSSEPPYPDSLCHGCAARQYVRGRATLFVMCMALPVKYPPQPVVRC